MQGILVESTEIWEHHAWKATGLSGVSGRAALSPFTLRGTGLFSWNLGTPPLLLLA